MFPKALKTVFEVTKANTVISGDFEESVLVIRAAVLRREKAAVLSLMSVMSPLDPMLRALTHWTLLS